MRFRVAVSLLIFSASGSHGLAAGCDIRKLAEIPVAMVGSLPLVTAKINGADAQFVADSGAFFSLITPMSAAHFKLRTQRDPFNHMLRGVGGTIAAKLTTVKEFTIAAVPLPDVEFVVGGDEISAGAAGLLGQNVLGVADVEYDLSSGVIRLMKPNACEHSVMAYWIREGETYSAIDISQATAASPHIMATAYLNGAEIRILFDTGTAASLLSVHAAEVAGVKTEEQGMAKAGTSRGIGAGAVQTWLATFASLRIGAEETRDIKLRIGALTSAHADMLIGADFFLSHRVYVASSQGKLYFTRGAGPMFGPTLSE